MKGPVVGQLRVECVIPEAGDYAPVLLLDGEVVWRWPTEEFVNPGAYRLMLTYKFRDFELELSCPT